MRVFQMIYPLVVSASALSLSLVLSSCNLNKGEPNIELIQDMMEGPSVKAQEYDEFFADHAGGARVPPEHTVPVGFKVYRAGMDPDKAKANRNPLLGDTSDEVLLTGQKFYDTNCLLCHGAKGLGDGPVSLIMPNKPPPVTSEKIKGWSDGQIYHVITVGQGLMGPYASHIPQKYRWQVVNYIRFLQKDAR